MTHAPVATVRGWLGFAAAATLLVLSGGRRAAPNVAEAAAPPSPAAVATASPTPRGEATGRQGDAAVAPVAGGEARSSAVTPAGPRAGKVVPVPSEQTGASAVEIGREILSRHCGTCHTPGLATSKAGALAIFSLADPDWSAHMTSAQICASGRRVSGVAKNAPVEISDYARVVDELLAKRGAPPCGS